ncbi:MAG: hypothetical protein FD143_3192, partial [Ignavibacteria bacterium]
MFTLPVTPQRHTLTLIYLHLKNKHHHSLFIVHRKILENGIRKWPV